jgi:hypothetical protein
MRSDPSLAKWRVLLWEAIEATEHYTPTPYGYFQNWFKTSAFRNNRQCTWGRSDAKFETSSWSFGIDHLPAHSGAVLRRWNIRLLLAILLTRDCISSTENDGPARHRRMATWN